jgi:hypothetical protein
MPGPETISGMALQPLSAEELAGTHTLFASFMGRVSRRHKTVGQLLAIYRERANTLGADQDRDDDLRVERFIDDMARQRWRSSVVMRIGVFDGKVLVVDGIHRGIAYLACLERGIGPERLPALQVDC